MKTMKMTILTLLAGSTLAISSCGAGKDQPATPINADQFEKLYENKDNDGKRFSLTGYPYLNSDVTVRNDMEIAVSLFSEPKGKGDYIASIDLGYKDNKNGMYIPDKFTADDLQVFDKEGNILGVNDKITISFEMELDTRRPPRTGIKKLEKDENGHPKMVEQKPAYYGDGPSDIIIEKAK
ncbi:hypothetical protein [Sphingobacterium sp. DR205]|uniref:hypothetical protein n=1 Tax=Sphingobacterium sp. DR205 TaxID=2713573 RepID=UPI0013E497F3|nr:hypothetical protein [Sphingobacterium sp. DR205]QIH34948.1 hypothetical protein G6053_19515 [Sphingobacterium sp. DR205]